MIYSDSLKRKLIAHGMTRGALTSNEVEDYARYCGYTMENGRRRMRELVRAGIFEREMRKGERAKYAVYKYIQSKEPVSEEKREQQLLMEALK